MVSGKRPVVLASHRGQLLDLCRDMVLDGLEDDIDLDALFVAARRRQSQIPEDSSLR